MSLLTENSHALILLFSVSSRRKHQSVAVEKGINYFTILESIYHSFFSIILYLQRNGHSSFEIDFG